MKAVVQRVKNASVSVDGNITGLIKKGLLVYLGVAKDDSEKDVVNLAEKIVHLRIFNDKDGKMNLSLMDLCKEDPSYGILAISQFTLLADTARGRRPFYGEAAEPVKAKELYELFISEIKKQGIICEAGIFQALMEVTYTNEGPVTIILGD